ncbi:ABC transporter permease [Pelagicoccus sp. NFK12]|uniref:ABC transporter permease n=1 Tax=Pelagicoccus enzymogenes TaxID=2773457 RepID=A0A927F932_9BACT|nr:ABC transporter permease [Pelagicoccus enzymogenes]MBD5779178.1 ABC transporter permease [Pelagicoccus enzymogenes]MDQ8198470.1 ABC transporter permease [Pelagicoccus enzymogenes]
MSRKPKRRSILLSDLVEQAFASLGANMLRSSLTILGVSIGVFSVVGVMTALSAVRHSIDTSLNVFGANVLQITKDPGIQLAPGPRRRARGREPISPQQAEFFKQEMDALGIPTTLSASDGNERASYRDYKTQPRIRIIGTNENFLLTNKYELDFGRNITPADIEFNRPVVVIGREILDELFLHEDPIEKQINMDGEKYIVVGVLAERGEIFGQSMDGIALIPHSKFVENNWHRRRSMEIAIQADSVDKLADVEDMVIGKMRMARGLEPEQENDFEITSNEALQAAFAEIAVVVGTGGLLISGIALVCAGIGIMNIMLVSVTERTREIGVRKSLGARKKSILAQFLLEAVFLSEVGAAIGISIGILVGNIIATQFNATMIIPWFWIGAAVGICSLIGIGFGFVPALRAANLHPVESLRHE